MRELYVLVRLGESEYALPARDVVEMESYSAPTPIPGAAPHVAGILQLRGRVIPVVDLRLRLGLPPRPPELGTRIVVVQQGHRHVGLVADFAREVLHVPTEEFHPPPELLSDPASGFVDGVAQLGPRLLFRLNAQRVIAPEAGPAPGPQEGEPHGAQDEAPAAPE